MHTLTVELGDLFVDIHKREAVYQGKTLSLANLEYLLLMYLINRAGQIPTVDQILHEVFDQYRSLNTIAVYVGTLRKTLGSRNIIVNHRGAGYSINLAFLNAERAMYRLNGMLLPPIT